MKVDILLGISYRIGREVTGDNSWLNNTRLSTKYIKARFTVATTHTIIVKQVHYTCQVV